MGARARAREAGRTTRVALLALALRAATTPAAVRATRRRRETARDETTRRRD